MEDDYYQDDDKGASVDQKQLSQFLLTFSGEFFFMVFLPPILFNSGYGLRQELFFRHLKPIISFALIGTAVSGVLTGLVMSIGLRLNWTEVNLNTLELLTFGSLIAATDTVSVLGVLNAKKVHPHLFSLVFGESALNDAVAIIFFRSFSDLLEMDNDDGNNVQTSFWVKKVARLLTEFLLDVLGCPMMGIVFSFLAALMFKHVNFNGTPVLELSLYILIMYMPFIFAEILEMSGIITIFFTGMFARRYVEPNVTDETKHNAEVIFNTFSFLAETCIFINLGLSVFGFSGSFHWAFIAIAFFSSLIGRAMAIYPISIIFNLSLVRNIENPQSHNFKSRAARRATVDVATSKNLQQNAKVASSLTSVTENDDESYNYSLEDDNDISDASLGIAVHETPEECLDKVIPCSFMHFLWFAGLRGAVAYSCARDFPDIYNNRDEVIAATLVIVFFSIIVMGAFCEPLLRVLDIRMNVDESEYMKVWHDRRFLTGVVYDLERKFIFNVVVRNDTTSEEFPETSAYHFNDANSALEKSKYPERSMTSSIARATLTGSQYF